VRARTQDARQLARSILEGDLLRHQQIQRRQVEQAQGRVLPAAVIPARAAAGRDLARQAEAEAGVAGQTPGRGTAKQAPSLDLAGEEHLSPVVRAALAAVRGDDARVFANLQEALTVNDANLVYLGLVPALARLHEDARFQSILSAARVAAAK